ncbi:MAG: hypothetical protein SPI84_03050 [Anaerovoracaceae bacterium]|nr:hypothetical protein [Anaerovoracaceae bacterium]
MAQSETLQEQTEDIRENVSLQEQTEDIRELAVMLKQLSREERREIKGIMIGYQMAKEQEPRTA